jgi:tetratricopeptide (TPR) repeat protein
MLPALSRRVLRPSRLYTAPLNSLQPKRLNSGVYPKPPIKIGEGEDYQPSFYQAFVEPSWNKSRGRLIVNGKRVSKQLLIFLTIVGLGFYGFQASTHLYVEHICLRPGPADDEVRQWQWDEEFEDWTGGTNGTDPLLSWTSKVLLRRAWMSTNWTREQAVVTQAEDGERGYIAVHADLARAEKSIADVLSVARQKDTSESTLAALLVRHATILEHLADKQSLKRARREYQEAIQIYTPSRPLDAASWLLRLGDVCSRLKDYDAANRSWSEAIQLSSTLPQSPRGQRITASAQAFSAYQFASTSRLTEARKIQESALGKLRSLIPTTTNPNPSTSESLHHLSLLQRSVMLSASLAEVIFAQSQQSPNAWSWTKNKAIRQSTENLLSAAKASEQVAAAITENPDPRIGPISKTLGTPYLMKPTARLLWDARRSATSAYTLLGTLSEVVEPDNTKQACQYYHEALRWAGDGKGNAGVHMLSAEWETLNVLYSEALVRRREQKKKV